MIGRGRIASAAVLGAFVAVGVLRSAWDRGGEWGGLWERAAEVVTVAASERAAAHAGLTPGLLEALPALVPTDGVLFLYPGLDGAVPRRLIGAYEERIRNLVYPHPETVLTVLHEVPEDWRDGGRALDLAAARERVAAVGVERTLWLDFRGARAAEPPLGLPLVPRLAGPLWVLWGPAP